MGNDWNIPVENVTYTSNYDDVYVHFQVSNCDEVDCEWTTIPGLATAVRNFKCMKNIL
jgi:hypothetical protein